MIETLHLDEGGGTSERRTTPSETQMEINKAPQSSALPHPPHQTQHVHNAGEVETEAKQAPVKKKLERRKIRFDDDPNENPTGILNAKTPKSASPGTFKSSLRTDKPELYDF